MLLALFIILQHHILLVCIHSAFSKSVVVLCFYEMDMDNVIHFHFVIMNRFTLYASVFDLYTLHVPVCDLYTLRAPVFDLYTLHATSD